MADTGFKNATATGEDYNQFANPTYAYADDTNYALETTDGEQQDYYNFTFGIPSGATINGVEVTLKGYADGVVILNGDRAGIKVDLSDNGGTAYGTKINKNFAISAGEITNTYGGATSADAYWGLTLTDTDFSNTNLRVRVEMDILTGGADVWYLNHIQVKVYYTEASGATIRLLASTGVGT